MFAAKEMGLFERMLPAPRKGGFAMDDYWIWCGSPICDGNGRHHLFASRWPRAYPFFEGYLLASEIVRAEAAVPEGPYEFREIVLPARGEGYWDGMMTHNPVICRTPEGYALFYIGSTYHGGLPEPASVSGRGIRDLPMCQEGYANIRIGVVTASSLHGPWVRRDQPVLSPRPKAWDSSIVTNPAPCVNAHGQVLMIYRTNTPQGLKLGVAKAENVHAPFERLGEGPFNLLQEGFSVEDPCLWWDGGHYEMIAKDCHGALGEPGGGIHALSRDGLHWNLAAQPKAYSRIVQWDDGIKREQGHLERPQVLLHEGKPSHLFFATGESARGYGFENLERTWNMVVPLRS